ncbi:zinc finger CCCH-type antiviral protein 1-like [Saccostrea echinata]|uniref:zinc finger CCCH-type antiviral protein 1-like n=1 Tax=Saccostrea echinata TaxID=191078 RepID=UPI002A82B852|nr:zinc finger CCCH-type antiviral protein 1-like [Saccostrea echinata]
MAYLRREAGGPQTPMTFSQFIKETAERILGREKCLTVSGLTMAIKNDPCCKYLQLKPLSLQKILQGYSESFSLKGSQEDPNVSLHLSIDVCDNVRNCPGFPQCKDLHICKYFMLDNCIHTKRKTRKPCPYPHTLSSKHNRKVLQHHHLLYMDLPTIKKMIQEESGDKTQSTCTSPTHEHVPLKLCYYYNRRACERENCSYLHLCEFFVKGTCKFGRRCKKSHDVHSRQVQEILSENNLDLDGDVEDILESLREELYGGSVEEEESDEEEDEEQIEVYSQHCPPRRSYTNFRRGDRH